MPGRPVELNTAELRRARVVRLLDLLYGGNQRRAARELGVSQAQLSRVIGGQRPVTDRLLDALTRQPSVNKRWLVGGEGEPLLPSTHGTLPVAHAILPGPPRDQAGLLTGDRHPVAEALEGDNRYWLPMRPYWSRAMAQRLWIAPDDMLLIEMDRGHLDRLDVVSGRLCAASVPVDGGQTFVLGLVSVEHGSLWIGVFDVAGDTVAPSTSPTSSAADAHFCERRRSIGKLKNRPREDEDEDQVTQGEAAIAEPTREASEGPRGAGDRRSVPGERAARWPAAPRKIRLTGLASIVGVVLQLERSMLSINNSY